MTITPTTVPVSPERVIELLAAGETTLRTAELTGWPRDRVVQLARGRKGWLLSAETDTVFIPADTDTDAFSHIPPLLMRAGDLDDPAVNKVLARVHDDLDRLRDAVAEVDRRAALEAKRQEAIAAVEEAERRLAAAKARARQLGAAAGKRTRKAGTGDGPTAKEIRAWAAENGVPCNERGHLPRHVTEQYHAAHEADA